MCPDSGNSGGRRFSIMFGYLLTSFARRYRRFRRVPIAADARPTVGRCPRTTVGRHAASCLPAIPFRRAFFVAWPLGSRLTLALLVLALPIQHATHGLAARVAAVMSRSTAGRAYRLVASRPVAKIFRNRFTA